MDDQSRRLTIRMVVVLVSSLVAIIAQCIALRIVLWSVGWANMILVQLVVWAGAIDPNRIPCLQGEFLCELEGASEGGGVVGLYDVK